MSKGHAIAAAALLLLGATLAAARGQARLDFFLGGAANLPTPLSIRQEGEPDIDLWARYDTRAFTKPLYWVLRLGWGNEERAWEIQLVHHKIHLSNGGGEVQHFEVSHGYNLLTLNRVWLGEPVDLRAGAGVVLPHAESRVRGESHSGTDGILGTEYPLRGPVLVAGLGKRMALTDRLSLQAEAQLSAAWATVPVARGEAHVPNVAGHFMLGLGYVF